MTLPKKGDRILAVNVGLFGTVVARGVGFNYSLTVHWDGDREPSTNAEGARLLSTGEWKLIPKGTEKLHRRR